MTAQLNPNQQLNVNDSLVAWNKATTLIMQDDGNLVLYRTDNNQALWSSGTWGKPVTHAIMQADGNFVCYDDQGVAYWSSGTWGSLGAFLILQDDGNLAIYLQNGEPVWASKTMLTPTAQLDVNQQLNINDKLIADNERTTLIMQTDGNLVLYRNYDNFPLWASNTAGKPVTHAILQPDGNFVCYDKYETPLWASGTQGHAVAWLQLQDDGNLALLPEGVSTEPLWTSMTTQDWDQADPGPPALLIEIEPLGLIDLSDADKLASFIDTVQAAVAPIAAKLQPVGLALAGPSAMTIFNPHDNTTDLRLGIWLLSPYFPFADADPDHPHQLPVLTPACATTGFAHVPLIEVPAIDTVPEATFAFSIPISVLNTLAQAELSQIQSKASQIGATVNSVTVTAQGPSVVVTISGSVGIPPANISGTISETPGLQAGSAKNTMVPSITGGFASGTDVMNQVLLVAADILGAPGILGVPPLIEAIGITFGVPPALGGEVGPRLAQLTALVNMIPGQLPFETRTPVVAMPDFPKLIFNWTTFNVIGSALVGRLKVTPVGRPAGSGSLTLNGPTGLVGAQSDMMGGAAAYYTVTWSDLAPTTDVDPADFSWQVTGGTGDSAGPIQAQIFPFTQTFIADFPLPDQVDVGRYEFHLTVTATEVDVKNTGETLTASAGQNVVVRVLKDPKTTP